MRPSEEMKVHLDRTFKWRLVNPAELDQPVLVVIDYSPSNDQCPISIAFDCNGGSKCWLSESAVYPISGEKPSSHADYRKFVFEGREFYPYSIEAPPPEIFTDIEQFEDVCRRLYQHTVRSTP